MNYVLKIMDSLFKMLDFVLKMMNYSNLGGLQSRVGSVWTGILRGQKKKLQSRQSVGGGGGGGGRAVLPAGAALRNMDHCG